MAPPTPKDATYMVKDEVEKKKSPLKKKRKMPLKKALLGDDDKKTPPSSSSTSSTTSTSKKGATSVQNKTASPVKKSPAKKSKASTHKKQQPVIDVDAPLDVLVPMALFAEPMGGGECSILVQIHPQDASLLDFESAHGAIGRLECHADNSIITLDLKGFQYDGQIHAGPTAMVMNVQPKTQQLKVDAITNEFLPIRQTHNIMEQLNAVVKGDLDASYKVVEENVNFTRGELDMNGSKESSQNKRKISVKTKKNVSVCVESVESS